MINRNCDHCDKPYSWRACPSDIIAGRGRYCSPKCASASRIKLPRSFRCPTCSLVFPNRYGKISLHCSKKCADKARVGKVGSNAGRRFSASTRHKQSLSKLRLLATGWRPTVTRGRAPWNKGSGIGRTLPQQIRALSEMKKWRKGVFLLWGNKCAKCPSTKSLHTHHIAEFQNILKEEGITTVQQAKTSYALWDVANGLLLCGQHHREVHSFYRDITSAMEELIVEGRAVQKCEIIAGRKVSFFKAAI